MGAPRFSARSRCALIRVTSRTGRHAQSDAFTGSAHRAFVERNRAGVAARSARRGRQPFELVLVRAMIGAAKADGHIDAAEQRRLFAEVERLGLDPDAKAYLFDLLTQEIDTGNLASAVKTEAQGAELYLAARLGIDPDEPAERAYLDELANGLKLPAALRARLEEAAAEK